MCFHQGSCQEAVTQQRGQLAAAVSLAPRTRLAPSSSTFSFLVWKREWVLHCIHPGPFIPPPRTAAPTVPQLDLMARVAEVPCPTNSHSAHWTNSGNQQLQNSTSNSHFIGFQDHLCPSVFLRPSHSLCSSCWGLSLGKLRHLGVLRLHCSLAEGGRLSLGVPF